MTATAKATGTRRTFTLSTRRIATEGKRYYGRFIGARVVYTTWEGVEMEGVIDRFEYLYPIAVFPDGRWARLDPRITVIV